MQLKPVIRRGGALVGPSVVLIATAPVRHLLPNSLLAIVGVALVAFLGARTDRITGWIGAAITSLTFDVLWTEPYGSLRIFRPADIAASVALAIGGGLLADGLRGAARAGGPRRSLRREKAPPDALEQLQTISRVAEGIADGDPAGLVTVDVARALVHLLKLRDCRFEVVPLDASDRPVLRPTGDVELHGTRWSPTLVGFSSDGFDLPVVASGRLRGRFVCTTRSRQRISADRLRAALTLANEAALALELADRQQH